MSQNVGVESPYRGLRPFTVRDADYFFGRGSDVKRLLAAIFSSPLTLVYGPSGVGKSSLINAGLLKEAERRGDLIATAFKDWSQGDALSKAASSVEAAATPFGIPSRPDHAGLERIGAVIAAAKTAELNEGRLRSPIVLVLDQFEDYAKYREKNVDFDQELAELIRRFGAGLSVIISIRQDNLSELDHFAPLIPGLFNSYVRVEHLDVESATAAIRQPLVKWAEDHNEPQVIVEDDLVHMVLRDVESDETRARRPNPEDPDRDMSTARIETAYLQLVLEHMWLERTGNAMTARTYVRLGKARQILRSHVEAEIERLGEDNKPTMARILPQLVTASGLKLAQNAFDINARTGVPVEQVTGLLEQLESRGRILRSLDATLPDRTRRRYEPFHDRLAEALNDWMNRYSGSDKATEKMRRRLRNQLEASTSVLISKSATTDEHSVRPAARLPGIAPREPEEQQKRQYQRSLDTLQALASNPVDPALAVEAAQQVRRVAETGPTREIRRAANELAEEYDAQIIGLIWTGIVGALNSIEAGLSGLVSNGTPDEPTSASVFEDARRAARDEQIRLAKQSLEADIAELSDLTEELVGFAELGEHDNKSKLAKETLETLPYQWGEELWEVNQAAGEIVAPAAAERLSKVRDTWGREPQPQGDDGPATQPWIRRPGRFVLSLIVMGMATTVGLVLGEFIASWWLERSGRPDLDDIGWPWTIWILGFAGAVLVGLIVARFDAWDYMDGAFLFSVALATTAYASIGWVVVNVVALIPFKTFDVSFGLILWPATVIALLIWFAVVADEV